MTAARQPLPDPRDPGAPIRPDLQQLVAAYGSFPAIPPEAWFAHDHQTAAHDRVMREHGLPRAKPAPAPAQMPTSSSPVATMTAGEVRAELKAGSEALAAGAVIDAEHRDRRQQLWRRLDAAVAAGRRTAP